jgi:hypothetical protein
LTDAERVKENSMLWLSFSKPREQEHPDDIVTLDDERTFNWGPPISKLTVADPISISSKHDKPASEANASLVSETRTASSFADPSKQVVFHEVKPSDTLYGVARHYGVTIKELMEWNDKKDFSLEVGEKLKINPD